MEVLIGTFKEEDASFPVSSEHFQNPACFKLVSR
jgi:hypothetical protein